MSNTIRTRPAGLRLKKGMHKKFLIVSGLLLAVYGGLSASPYGVKMTVSSSVEHSVFVTKKQKSYNLVVGQYVTVKTPTDPSSHNEYIKIVAGLPGDEVKIDGRDIYVAGVYRGRAKEVSLKGEPLEIMEGGVVPEGYIYLFAPSLDSYDSRYKAIGFVPMSFVTSVAKGIV